MQTLVLINERSGAVADLGAKECVRLIHEFAGGDDIECEIAAGDPGRLIRQAENACQSGNVSSIIVIGGDGTLAAIAGVVAKSDMPIMPLPGGTMNAFSLDLGFAADLTEAIKQIPETKQRAVDIAFAGEHAFLNNVVFGAYTSVASSRERIREVDTIGEKIEAATEAIGALAFTDTTSYTVNLDGKNLEAETNTIMVANNIYTGADLPRPIREHLNAGVLGLYIAQSKSSFDFISVLADAVSGHLSDSEKMDVYRGQVCRVSSEANLLAITVDGEAMEVASPIEISLKPGGLNVLAP